MSRAIKQPDPEDLYQAIVAHVRQTGWCKLSNIQRQFRLNLFTAARIVDRLQAEGIVGPVGPGMEPRKVLR